MNKSLIYFLLLLCTYSYAQTNSLYKKTFTEKDGLDLENINTLCFDNDGFLWLGGKDLDVRTILINNKKLALQRFNGLNFHSIPLPDYGFDYTAVNQIYKRNDGLFYVKISLNAKHVLFLFNPKTTEYKPIKFYDDIEVDALSKIIKFNNKDYILSQKDRTITLNILNKDLSVSPVFSFTSNENKFLLDPSTTFIPFKDYCIIGDDNFPITILDWEGNIIKRYDSESFNRNRDSNKNKFWIDEYFIENDTLYTFLNNNPTLHRFNKKSLQFIPLKSKNNTLISEHLNCYTDSNNKTIVSSSIKNTIYFNAFHKSLKSLDSISVNKIDRIQIISKNLNNDLWIATHKGLHYIKFPKKTVKTYLKDKQLRAIKPLDSINYLIATDNGGWYQFNTANDSIFPFVITENSIPVIPISSRNFIVEDDIIWSNSAGKILKVNKRSHNITAYRHYPINCIEKANDSIIVYGTKDYHLMQFNTHTEIHSYLVKTDTLEIHDIELNKEKQFVVAGTDKGLLTYNLKTKETNFYNDLEDNFILMTDYHKDYGYLLGTRSGHIVAFNPKKEVFKTLYRDDLKAGIATIIFKEDYWWINTFNGVVTFNPKDKTTNRFSEKDGFSHFENNRYSALKTSKGFLVGAIRGLNYFKPEDLKPHKDSASLTLLSVRQYNKKDKIFLNNFNQEQFTEHNTITLPSENRMLDIDFGLKHIYAVDKGYNYKYRLDDKNWVNLLHKNSIQFPNLAAGNYILEIEASDFSGKTIGESLILKIKSQNFFYKTWWFYLLVLSLISAFLLWLLKQAKHKRLLQETFSQGLIQSQENERKRIAKELHDSVSQQLTLIKKKAQKTKQQDITALTHNTLEEVRAISRGLYPPLLKQLGLTESIEQLILDVDEQTDVFVSGDIAIIDPYFSEDDTLNCYRFIQECINNVLKHANAKALSISIIKKQNTLNIAIKDNGKGFNLLSEEKKNSLGLKTMYERIRILKGELTIDSKPNSGTTVTAVIPIKNV